MDVTHEAPRNQPLNRNAMLVLLAIGPEERHGYAIMREAERLTGVGATVRE